MSNIDLGAEIAELAMSIVESVIADTQDAAARTAALISIIQKGAQAYQQQTGQPVNLLLIRGPAAA